MLSLVWSMVCSHAAAAVPTSRLETTFAGCPVFLGGRSIDQTSPSRQLGRHVRTDPFPCMPSARWPATTQRPIRSCWDSTNIYLAVQCGLDIRTQTHLVSRPTVNICCLCRFFPPCDKKVPPLTRRCALIMAAATLVPSSWTESLLDTTLALFGARIRDQAWLCRLLMHTAHLCVRGVRQHDYLACEDDGVHTEKGDPWSTFGSLQLH